MWRCNFNQVRGRVPLLPYSPFTLELRTVPEPFQAQCKRMQNRSKPIRFAGIGSTYKCRSRPIQNGYYASVGGATRHTVVVLSVCQSLCRGRSHEAYCNRAVCQSLCRGRSYEAYCNRAVCQSLCRGRS